MLRISYPPMRVFVGSTRMQPKVAPVLALMAVRAKQYPPEQAWVSAAEVALLPDWRTSKSKSVGTEVYNAFRRLGLQQSGLIESPHLGKVTKWRFKPSIEVNWQPDFDSVAKAVAEDAASILTEQTQASNTPNAKLDLAEELSRIRLEMKFRAESDDVLQQILENNALRDVMGAIDNHSLERIEVIPLSRAKSLAQQATILLKNGDSSTAATLFNAAGCIANAEKSFDQGKRWLTTAIPLLLAHGALVELEAALFNLAINTTQQNERNLSTRAATKKRSHPLELTGQL